MYRSDGFWQAHHNPRVWMVQRIETPPEGWLWSGRGIHSGHLPLNYKASKLATVPKEYSLLHFGYLTPRLRQDKFLQYKAVRHQLSTFEWRHAQSILDDNPFLK